MIIGVAIDIPVSSIMISFLSLIVLIPLLFCSASIDATKIVDIDKPSKHFYLLFSFQIHFKEFKLSHVCILNTQSFININIIFINVQVIIVI